MVSGRRVLLAVTGGVAAYKSILLTRLLVEAGASVEVILTESAHEFVGPQTFSALTGKRPHTDLFGDSSVSPHTELARWADIAVVVPATAATMSKVANGLSIDLVSATLLAFEGPVLWAPAMHTEMWEHPATKANLEKLLSFGHQTVGPESGALAGGDTGMGRVSEPEDVFAAIDGILAPATGRKMLVTAGGTREPIDPVRYLGNRSSGKMGHAIATAGWRRGFDVTLITTSDLPSPSGVKVVHVETANEMLDAVTGVDADVAIMSAAVADFRPKQPREMKLSRSEGLDSIATEPNPDILATVVAREPRPFVVGFAAETGDVERAVAKAEAKDVDLMVYNDVTEPGSGFGTDTNRVILIRPGGETEAWPMMDKSAVAEKLVATIAGELSEQG